MNKILENLEKANELACIFKALAHPIRVRVIAELIQGHECNVTEMVRNFNVSQPTISQHINVLKTLGIIKGYRKGNKICYRINNEIVEKIYSVLA